MMSRRARSAAWSAAFRLAYALLRILDPAIRVGWRLGLLGITVELRVRGRRTGRERRVLVGLLDVDGRWYVGHPNGPVGWTRNLEAAGSATVRRPGGPTVTVRAVRLPAADERRSAIFATARQQPFPANLVYRAARRHILQVGVYFRLEPEFGAPPG